MGNDPFASPPFTEEEQVNSVKPIAEKKTPTLSYSLMNKTITSDTSELIEEIKDIQSKLDLARQELALQQKEIDILRKELYSLRLISNFSKYNPFIYWLRFWFPWFTG